MTHGSEIVDELHLLRQEASRLLGAGADEWREFSAQKAKTLANDVKAFLTDLRTSVEMDEREIEHAIAGKTATALVTALTLGIVIGWAMRKKP